MDDDIIVTVDNGVAQFVYDDALADLLTRGHAAVRRVSHVEPTDDGRGWTATMVDDGVVLGPFATRALALDAERKHLRDHYGL